MSKQHWLITYQQNRSNGEPMQVHAATDLAPVQWLIKALSADHNQGTNLVMLNWLPLTAANYKKLRELL